jgi:glutathione peroxidase
MTLAQTIKQKLYHLFFNKGKGNHISNHFNKQPLESFYALKALMNNGQEFSFEQLRGKKVMIANTASDRLFTGQYDDLEKLHRQYKDKLVILGFPANDFDDQEKGSDTEIAQFCKVNFGVTFQLMRKNIVVKKNGQNEVYQWLTDANKNGWNNKQPGWNFCKYLIDEEGVLMNYFESSVSPLSSEVRNVLSLD